MREFIAYGIIGLTVLIGAPWLISVWNARKKEHLRRRGIKDYGH